MHVWLIAYIYFLYGGNGGGDGGSLVYFIGFIDYGVGGVVLVVSGIYSGVIGFLRSTVCVFPAMNYCFPYT